MLVCCELWAVCFAHASPSPGLLLARPRFPVSVASCSPGEILLHHVAVVMGALISLSVPELENMWSRAIFIEVNSERGKPSSRRQDASCPSVASIPAHTVIWVQAAHPPPLFPAPKRC